MSTEFIPANAPLTELPPAVVQTYPPVAPSVGTMLQSAIASGVTAENVAVLEKLMDLYERTQAKEAEKEFARAFVALQADMPAIIASRAVPNNDGSVRYMFAPYEQIMEQVRPLLLKHGFTVSFSMSFSEGRVTQACTLQHTGGHARTNQFTARIGRGPPGSTETQGDGAASTYAKRFALCDCLNIVVERDNDGRPDARAEGGPISADQVQYLREQLHEAGGTEAGLAGLAGVATLEEVGTLVYPVLVRALEARKRAKK